MLRNIRQTSVGLDINIRHYGCLFLCFAFSSPLEFSGDIGVAELNRLWNLAIAKGYISGDMNGDGDLDDNGEAIVQEHEMLARDIFHLPLTYDNRHRSADSPIPDNVAVIFGRYVYKYGHFVVIDHDRNVIFDPLGESNTVKFGKLESMRWYYAG